MNSPAAILDHSDSITVRWTALLPFAGAIFLGAFLLFQVQPLIGKYVLPWFGGAPAVWTACMLFFQTLLLAGYAYAHLSSRYLSPRVQAIVHVALLIAAVCVLPVAPSARWKPHNGDDPTLRILLLLIACVGLPYFALSATGPLLQAWFARRWPARSPYRLYALSNIASFLALLSYPVLVEPMFSRHVQSTVWSFGLLVFAFVCGYCAIQAGNASAVENEEDVSSTTAVSFRRYFLWLLLPACASLLLLAVTNTICQDIAVIPLLWIVPLAIYLLTFVICFDSPKWYDRRVFVPLMLVGLGLACWAGYPGNDDLPIPERLAAYLIALFACCVVCHGELYRLKPPTKRLTSFYLFIAAGGSLGGVFVAIVAPLIFSSYAELQVGLMLAFVLLGFILFGDRNSWFGFARSPIAWYLVVLAGAVLGLLLWAGASTHLSSSKMLWRSRNFYGVLTVYEQGSGLSETRLLQHGTITHGLQLLSPQNQR